MLTQRRSIETKSDKAKARRQGEKPRGAKARREISVRYKCMAMLGAMHRAGRHECACMCVWCTLITAVMVNRLLQLPSVSTGLHAGRGAPMTAADSSMTHALLPLMVDAVACDSGNGDSPQQRRMRCADRGKRPQSQWPPRHWSTSHAVRHIAHAPRHSPALSLLLASSLHSLLWSFHFHDP